MTNLDELRKKAEECPEGLWYRGASQGSLLAGDKFEALAEMIPPSVVLELIAEIERLREEAAGWV